MHREVEKCIDSQTEKEWRGTSTSVGSIALPLGMISFERKISSYMNGLVILCSSALNLYAILLERAIV